MRSTLKGIRGWSLSTKMVMFSASILFLAPCALAQSPGYPAVASKVGTTGTQVYSSAYVDASAYCTVAGSCASTDDFCTVVNTALTKLPTTGGVVDARGVMPPGTTGNPPSISCAGTMTFPSPSTVLLPAGTIHTTSTWTLSPGTRLIGEGGEDPGVNPQLTRTIIEAKSGFLAGTPILKMGSTAGCTGVSIEDLVVDGVSTAGDVNGIDNLWCGDQSYVRSVTIYAIKDIGLNIGYCGDQCANTNAANSGPYTNITFDLGSSTLGSNGVTYGVYINITTRGIQGITCTDGSITVAGGTCIYLSAKASNNSIEDVRIEGLWTGVDILASNTVVMNVDGDTNPKTSTSVLNVVKIEAATTNVVLIGIMNNCTIASLCASGSGDTPDASDATINDTVTGAKITVAVEPFVAMYALGDQISIGTTGSAYSRYTTSSNPSTTTTPAANWSVGSGAPPTSTGCAPGSLYSNTNGSTSTAALWVCSAVNTTFQKWQAVK